VVHGEADPVERVPVPGAEDHRGMSQLFCDSPVAKNRQIK
jgi:hypothetical protein